MISSESSDDEKDANWDDREPEEVRHEIANVNALRRDFADSKLRTTWIPPRSLRNADVAAELKKLEADNAVERKEGKEGGEESDKFRNGLCLPCKGCPLEGVLIGWGKRTQLHDVLDMNYGKKLWNVVSRGAFAEIELRANKFGKISCTAVGKACVVGSTEKSIMVIETTENLRKLLNLSRTQWLALCDAVLEAKCALRFDAFKDADLANASPLERLWFFACKRRHFLPNVCILGRLTGAVKLMREFVVAPKITVLDVRDVCGQPIE